jgi:hypothetical protein
MKNAVEQHVRLGSPLRAARNLLLVTRDQLSPLDGRVTEI